MPKPNPNRQAIVEYVQREIEQHMAGVVDRFTTPRDLSDRFHASDSTIRKYLSRSSIPQEYLIYRNSHICSQVKYGRVHSEETKRKISNAHRGKIYSQETRRRIAELSLGRTFSEETRRKLSEAHKGKTHLEETRRRIAEANKGRTLSEETKRKISLALSGENSPNYGKTLPEETRRKMSGENHPRWNGGSSFLPYSPEFVKVMKEYIRARDDYQCQFCDAPQNGKAHAVHHIDHDKDNDSEYNLIILCELCHNNESTSSGKLREEFIQYCRKKVEEIYAGMTEQRRAELHELKASLERRLEGVA